MTTARDGAEYGDVTRLPLFAQPVADSASGATARPALHDLLAEDRAVTSAGVDWKVVAALRAQASEQLSRSVAADHGRLDRPAQEELGRSIVLDLVESTMAEAVNGGEATWTPHRQRALAQAVFD